MRNRVVELKNKKKASHLAANTVATLLVQNGGEILGILLPALGMNYLSRLHVTDRIHVPGEGELVGIRYGNRT